jgi:hypothetical protein
VKNGNHDAAGIDMKNTELESVYKMTQYIKNYILKN